MLGCIGIAGAGLLTGIRWMDSLDEKLESAKTNPLLGIAEKWL
jgi:hypothetical protein